MKMFSLLACRSRRAAHFDAELARRKADSNQSLLTSFLTRAICLLAICGWIAGTVPFSAHAWILETPLEFITEGDFDGDGRLDVLVLDKETGSARAAFQNASTNLHWQTPFASGIANATSISVGKLSSTSWDSLAVTGPDANRINKLEPRDLISASGISPISIYPPGVGPNLVAVLDVGGAGNTAHDDYFVATRENPGSRRALLRNDGVATSALADIAMAQPLTSAHVVELKSTQGNRLAAISRLAGVGLDSLLAFDFTSAGITPTLTFNIPLTNFPSRPEFVAHRFDTNNALAQILFYRPSDSAFLKYQLQEVPALSLGSSNKFELPGSLQNLQPLPLSNGARLLAFFGSSATNLTNAMIYSFDGVNAPQIVQSYVGNFSGALALGGGNLALLNSDGTGRSSSFQMILANGNGYVLGASGDLPKLNRFSGTANALLFDVEPFVNKSARPRQLQRHADWSTALKVTPTVQVTGQQFLNSMNGLGSPSTRDFGAPISGVSTGLVNQYTPTISIFSGRDALGNVEGEIRIAPPAGHFGEAQRLSLSINAPGSWQLFYRVGGNQNWFSYAAPFLVISNATVEFYGKRADGALTPFGRANYTFSSSIGELDSDHDGVPDFVEQTRGLDPLGGPDSDGDGFTDLEELAKGTNPLSVLSKPPGNASLRNAFNRLVTPRSPHPNTGAATKSHTNVSLRAFALGGTFLGEATTSAALGTGITNPAALFVNLLPEPGTKLLVETTPDHFDVNAVPDSRVGRELIGLFPVPENNEFSVNFTFGNGSLATQTANWIAAASNAVASATNPIIAGLLGPENSLLAALFEKHYANALLARGTNWATNATLFGFRSGDANRKMISAEDLISLRLYSGTNAPGYSQQTVFEFLEGSIRKDANLAPLVNFARELWRISAAQNNTNEGLFPLPYDELRRLLAGQTLSSSYTNFPSIAGNLTTARNQASNLLVSIPPRPRTNLTLVVTAIESNANSIQLQTLAGVPVFLWRSDGLPFAFPPNLQLLPGAQVSVFGHTDLASTAGSRAIEIISLSLAAVPMPSPSDADGNLLADSWEELFFGEKGLDAFGDADGDGYSNLQEMMAGSQPDDALIVPIGPPYDLTPPEVTLIPSGGELRFVFMWPAAWIGEFDFGLQASDDVAGPYLQTSTSSPIALGGDQYELRANVAPGDQKFYRMTLQLSQD